MLTKQSLSISMRVQKNDDTTERRGGTTLYLAEGDDLADVPGTHSDLITPELRQAFQNPRTRFSEIAAKTTIPNLGTYLSNFVSAGQWTLILADLFMPDRETIAGFQWFHPMQHHCLFTLSEEHCEIADFSKLYSDFQLVHWGKIAYSGGLLPTAHHHTLSQWGYPSLNSIFPAETTLVFGKSSCGDAMIWNEAGTAGYLSHEDGQAYVIGSFVEMLDWVFGELVGGKQPEY